MKQAGVDYKSKFKEINWTADINKEIPIRFSGDKASSFGREMPITVSQAFIDKVSKSPGEECMKMLNLKSDGYADIEMYNWT